MIKVIIVDDCIDFTDNITKWLELKKIEVIGIGHDGKQAVELFHELRPDVIILDLLMPRWDGFYAIEKIRQNHPESKIVVMTGMVDKKTKERLSFLNVLSIYKPFDMNELLKTINSLIYS